MWKCKKCGAIVADTAEECPLCSAPADPAQAPGRKHERRHAHPPTDQEPSSEEVVKDAEGYTLEERMKKRPLREIANANLIRAQRERIRWNRRKNKKGKNIFSDEVVPGSLRTSRPIFIKPVKKG